MWLEEDQSGYGISFRESRQPLFPVLGDAALQMVSDSDIEDAGCACQDIDVVDQNELILSRANGYCHSERSEESWLDVGSARVAETKATLPLNLFAALMGLGNVEIELGFLAPQTPLGMTRGCPFTLQN